MAYTKQNFEDGQVLTAKHLNNMEQGIEDAANPFYAKLVEVFPETVVDLSNKIDENAVELSQDFALTGDSEYEVTFDGTKYVCTSVDFSALGGIIYLGNDALMGNESTRTEPFCIVTVVGSEPTRLIVSDAAAMSCTISVRQKILHPLPVEYMPYNVSNGDTLYWDGTITDKDVTAALGSSGSQIFIKVSDAVPTAEELAKGVAIREYMDGTYITTEVGGPLEYPADGTLWLGMLLPTVAIVNGSSIEEGSMSAGIYFVITKAELGAGMMEFRAHALTVPGFGKFNSCPTVDDRAISKYMDVLCVNRLIFRSPMGRLFALSVSDDGETLFDTVGEG